MAHDIDRARLLDLLEHGDVQLIDVLPAAEYGSEHIPGSISIPLREMTEEAVEFLDLSKPTVVY